MAQIRTDQRRYYERFSDGREDGLGLRCEAAAERYFAQTGAPAFDDRGGRRISKPARGETELENVLFSMRDAVPWRAEDAPLDDKADRLYRTAKAQQEQYDDRCSAPRGEDEDADETTRTRLRGRWRAWRESVAQRACSRCAFPGFEINKAMTGARCRPAKARLPRLGKPL